MGLFEDTIAKANEIFSATKEVTEEAIAVQKLKFEKSSINTEINKKLKNLGDLTYSAAINETDESEKINTLIEEIKELKENVIELELKIAKAQNKKICSCGAINTIDSEYCKTCGKEI